MKSEHDMARVVLEVARDDFVAEVAAISLDEALEAGGGLRSILGLMKHTAGWTEVYRSFAFDEVPMRWTEIAWPRGLRERIDRSERYLNDVRAWFDASVAHWLEELGPGVDLAEERGTHWGERLPLGTIIALSADHISYHAGEINMILAIRRGEAWEYGEHVEENHIRTGGHSVRRPWMTDEDVRRHEEDRQIAAQDD